MTLADKFRQVIVVHSATAFSDPACGSPLAPHDHGPREISINDAAAINSNMTGSD